jgi:hypothetical protein
MKSIGYMIQEISSNANISDIAFNSGATEMELIDLKIRCEFTLNCQLPSAYINMLAQYDGFSGEGVFLYSSQPRSFEASKARRVQA